MAGAVAGDPPCLCTRRPARLDAPLAPGARGSVAFDVDIRVPDAPDRFGHREPLALLSNAIPALAHLEGGRWRLDRYFPLGRGVDVPDRGLARAARRRRRGVAVAAPGVLQPDGSRRIAHGPRLLVRRRAGCARSAADDRRRST